MFLTRLTGPNAVLPIHNTLTNSRVPRRSVLLLKGEIRTFPSGGPTEARWLGSDEAVLVGTYDAGVSARQLWEDIQASLSQYWARNAAPGVAPIGTPCGVA